MHFFKDKLHESLFVCHFLRDLNSHFQIFSQIKGTSYLSRICLTDRSASSEIICLYMHIYYAPCGLKFISVIKKHIFIFVFLEKACNNLIYWYHAQR